MAMTLKRYYKPYEKTTWVDNETRLNAENLNHIEEGIDQLYTTCYSVLFKVFVYNDDTPLSLQHSNKLYLNLLANIRIPVDDVISTTSNATLIVNKLICLLSCPCSGTVKDPSDNSVMLATGIEKHVGASSNGYILTGVKIEDGTLKSVSIVFDNMEAFCIPRIISSAPERTSPGGDVGDNGKIDISDVSLLRSYVSGVSGTYVEDWLDLNMDGQITADTTAPSDWLSLENILNS